MNSSSKKILFISALILIGVFFFPIWNINLEAPQYPEGLGLRIWVNQITGLKENDLQNINGLNHYIGMKPINPDDIPELKIMPFVIGFMILFGLFNAFKGNKKLVYVWFILFLFLGAIGIYDFYKWEYNYGHNLNPNAPIKVPGMTYQPPLIGSKQLLNINAISFPSISFYIILVSIFLSVFAIYINEKLKKKVININSKAKVSMILLTFILIGCSPKPEPIDYGNDICEFCKMNITDNKYAAEIVTNKSKVYKFDSIECLFQFKKIGLKQNEQIYSEWVNDFSNPGELIDLKKAYFLKCNVFRSPMGMNVLSVSSLEKLNEMKSQCDGEILNYNEAEKLALQQ